ncbi:MAG TPA: CbtA family protein [Candidatus Nanopelagicales bacterium]|nr:CbtA family protein [Candidatus Nanopelagicales bacterium]
MSARDSLSARDFLIRGLLAGLIAACAAFAVAYVVGEPPVRAAIALEDSAGSGHTHGTEAGDEHAEAPAPGEVEVPRSLQSTLGLLTGLLVAGVTIGGLAGVLSAIAMGRFGRLTPRTTTLAVAAIGFVTVYAVPFLIYPPNPPAVGSGDTIGLRSALYFIALAISLIAAVTAILVGRGLATRLGGWHAALVGIAGYLVVMLVVAGLLPQYNEVPATFPASVLYDFRRASFLTQLTLWAVLGVVLADLVGRLSRRGSASEPALADVRG